MKKLISLVLCLSMVLMVGIMPVMAIEESDPVNITIHYKNVTPDVEVGLVTIGNTQVQIDLGGGLIDTQYGWSQFDAPFETDDFGIVFKFTAGYIETDVSEIIFRPSDWSELTKISLPINKQKDGKIEVWVTGKEGSSDCDISYSAPGAAAAAAPAAEAPAAEAAAPAAEAPAANPQTGDNNLIYIAVAGLALSACGLFILKKKVNA